MKIRTLQLNINKVILVRGLTVSVLLLVGMYVYLINSVAFDASSVREMTKMISIKQSYITELESILLAQSKSINREQTNDLGLSKTVLNDSVVVLRETSTRLSLNE